MRAKSAQPDQVLLVAILLLVVFGVVMVFSASFPRSIAWHNNGWHFFVRQLIWASLGLVVMSVTSRINYRKWQELASPFLVITILLLLALFIPGVGMSVQGSTRWIGLGFFNVQPSEIAKVTLMMWVATILARKSERGVSIAKILIPVILMTALVVLPIFFQPDLSTSVAIALVVGTLLMAAGLPWIWIGGIVIAGVLGIYYAVVVAGYHMARLTAFLDPWADPLGSGFQTIQSLYSIALGGLFGRGLGGSLQKAAFLPEAHNDFIFAVTSEELGFVGGTLLISLFAWVAVRGFEIASKSPDRFGGLMATGITAMVVGQAIMNMAVVTALVPVTGITLPLISYGGSSLVIVLGALGILLNISKHTVSEVRK